MLGGRGKILLMLRDEKTVPVSSGWARIHYDDYAGRAQVTAQELPAGE